MREFAFLLLITLALCGFGGGKAPLTWIAKYDGSTSCGTHKGMTLDEGKTELAAAGIKTEDARKTNDGKMHLQMCGAPTGSMNVYRIEKNSLPKAAALGYREITEPKP